MAYTGINFRETAGFVTDPAGHTYCTAADAYPTTRGGITFGVFGGSPDDRNQDDAIDPRIAGAMYRESASSVFVIQIDIPPGTYNFRLGCGAHDMAMALDVHLLDDYTDAIWTGSAPVVMVTSAADKYTDAEGTEHDAADWPANNVAVEGVIVNGPLILHCEVQGGFGMLSHISWEEVGAAEEATLYLLAEKQGATNYGRAQLGGSPPTTDTTETGCRVEGLAAGKFARMQHGVTIAIEDFGDTDQPDGEPDPDLGDCFVTDVLSGVFAADDFTIQIPLIAVLGEGAGVRAIVRVWKSADGVTFDEITTEPLVCSSVTALQDDTAQISSGTVALPEITLDVERLYFQVAFETV